MTTTQHTESATKSARVPPKKKANGVGAVKRADAEPLFSEAHAMDARRARAWLNDRIERSKALPEGELLIEAVEITPVLAEIMLAEHNRGNRPLKLRRFLYAEVMKNGEWKFHSQGLSFARDGLLNNGQNRLTAVVLAGRPVRMMVAFGEDRDVFPVIDTGATRGGSDSLHIAGHKNTTYLAAAARLFRTVTSNAPRGNASYSNEAILQIVAEHPRLEHWTTDGGKVARKIRGATTAGPTVAFYLIAERSSYSRRLETFVNQLTEGNIPSRRDPILVLREALKDRKIPQKRTSGSGTAAEVGASIILAWNLWVRGRKATLAHITWQNNKPFPTPE